METSVTAVTAPAAGSALAIHGASLDRLLQIIRRRCRRATWSKGAQIVRGKGVAETRTDENEVELTVTGKSQKPAVVTLFIKDEDWACECTSNEEVCVHLAAATIALKRQRQAEQPTEPEAVHVGYRFERHDGKLVVKRVLAWGKHERPLTSPLGEVAQAGVEGRKLEATPQDNQVETLLASFNGGAVPEKMMLRLLANLYGARDIKLNGRPVQIGRPSSGLCIRVEECGLGFRLRLDKDPAINEVFQNGALRRGIKVMPVEPHRLGERWFAELRAGKIYEERDVGVLVGEVLPKLQMVVPVRVDTPKLPKSAKVLPRLWVKSSREHSSLVLETGIIYGDPPFARLEGEHLTLLSDHAAPVRDSSAELKLKQRLYEALALEVGQKRTYPTAQAIAAAGTLARLSSDPLVLLEGEAHREFYEAAPLEAKLDMADGGDFDLWFQPVGKVPEGAEARKADPEAVLAAWQRGEQLVPLLGGGWSRLPGDWLEKYGHRVADLLASKRALEEGPKQPSGGNTIYTLNDLAELAASMNMPPPPGFEKLKATLRDFEGIPKARLPKINGELREYQRDGANWLCFLRDNELGALLADDMGLGKTLQTLCAIKGKTLVVAPTSVLHNWATEIARFRPSLKVNAYHGPDRELPGSTDVTLTTYAILRIDAERLIARDWDMVVLDEAQAIKNPTSQVAKAAFQLKAKFRVALTGTPVENRLEDLWSQFHFVNRGLLGGRGDFHERYVKPIASGEPDSAARLRERIRPFVLRRLKSEVAKELPPRTEMVLRCELSQVERDIYDAVRAATRKEVAKKLSGSGDALAVLEALLRLRQASCHPALIPGQEKLVGESSAKLDLLAELLDELVAEGHKALVFSQWTSLLDLVEPQLKKIAVPFTRLDGSTKDRKKVVNEFQDPNGPKVMLISLKAGGTGLNLTAADNVILLDPWWNPAVEDQAADRAHRIGQERPVIVHRLVAQETVEERILELQGKKRELANAAVGDAAKATAITREELLALLD